MLIALTGATGFVGRAVTARLVGDGHEVRALTRKGGAAAPDVERVEGTLSDTEALDALVKEADAVLHIAGRISAPTRELFHETNAAGTARIVQAAARAGVARFVYVSSLSAKQPGLSDYGASKAAGEAAVKEHGGAMHTLIVRPPAVYGPGDRATLPLIKALTSNPVVLPGRASSRFSLVYVGDLAKVLAESVASDRRGVVEVDDGTPGGYGWEELVSVASHQQRRKLRPYFLPFSLCLGFATLAEAAAKMSGKAGMVSRAKIRELYFEDWVAEPPGWPLASPTKFDEGFAATLKWYREAGWLPAARSAMVESKARM